MVNRWEKLAICNSIFLVQKSIIPDPFSQMHPFLKEFASALADVWIAGCRLWIANRRDCGLWIVNCGLQIVDCGFQILDCGLQIVFRIAG